MNVKELINQLQQYDGELTVKGEYEGISTRINKVYVDDDTVYVDVDEYRNGFDID